MTYLAAVDTVLARYALPKSSDEEIYMAFQGCVPPRPAQPSRPPPRRGACPH